MVAASNLRLQQSFEPIWPEMFLPTFDSLTISIFFDFSSKCQFSRTQNKILRQLPDLEEFFSPDHFLTCDNHE